MKLCDTSVLVDIDRGGVAERVEKLDAEGRHAISMVTVTELRLGIELGFESASEAYHDAIDGLERLLARFEILPVSRAVAIDAATIIATLKQRGEPLNDLHDVYIAATARTERLPVLTANVSHFERIDELEVGDWTSF
ncbi:type II toxin-antitoxin system VapC family toxin [Natrialbaceae archaeon A-gly3]